MKVCSIEGCGRKHEAKGFCNRHYHRLMKHGDPLGGSKTFAGEPAKWLLEHLDYEGDYCLIWPYSRNAKGYGKICIDGKMEIVHVVVAAIKYGPKPTPKHECRHLCGQGYLGCVAPNHLRWATASENQMDRVTHGTSNRGERHGQSKLTGNDVLEIVKDERFYRVIAADYGVVHQTVFDIKTGKSWGWLTGIKP